MVDAFLEIFPEAELGHIGLERNETTAQPDSYYSKLPELAGKRVLLLDPMLATGSGFFLLMLQNYSVSRSKPINRYFHHRSSRRC